MGYSDRQPSYLHFDKTSYHWSPDVDYHLQPEMYKVGKGEQGVLICEPYKSDIGRHWRFKNEELASKSGATIFRMFQNYLRHEDFVGADMARKYLQMGFTRARRYANYKGGTKYDKANNYALLVRGTGTAEKAAAAVIFYNYWQRAEENPLYAIMKLFWKQEFG